MGAEITRQTSGHYLVEINDAIDKLSRDILEHANNSNTNHGFMAEYWHADTLNIMAKVMRTSFSAKAQDSAADRLVLGGADIITSAGDKYGLKYFDSGYGTAMHQARPLENLYHEYLKTYPETTRDEFLAIKHLDPKTDFTLSLYEGQSRLCPADQIDDVRKALIKKIASLKNNLDNPDRAKYAKAYEETLAMITDHIEGPNGEESIPLTYEQSRQLMSCAKEGKFDPKDFDVDAARLADKSFLLMNSLEAGATAGLISGILTLAPQLMSILKSAIEDGIIDIEDLEKMGTSSASAAAEGFIRGSMVSCISTAAELGYLGDAMKAASSSANFSAGVATAVSVVIAATKETVSFTRGTIDVHQYSANLDRTMFVACASYAMGSGVQALTPELPYIGYMVGSFIGSVLGNLAFEVKETFFMSLCVRNGYTLWGIVDQDYTLPREIAEKLGYQMMERKHIEECEFVKYSVKPVHFRREMFNYQRLDFTPMVRGVVGVRKVGYVKA